MTPTPEQPFDEESLFRALRAPGSPAELGDAEKYAAMFREARAGGATTVITSRGGRAASRFGAGSAFVIALAVGGSAAAAYTNNLPEPIQSFAHHALGPVAPPAPVEAHPRVHDRATTPPPAPTPTAPATPATSATPSATATARPTHGPPPSASASEGHTHPPKPDPTPTATAAQPPTAPPSVAPTPTATTTATATPPPTPPPSTPPVTPGPPGPPAAPAALSISGSTHQAAPGQSVTFSGVVTSADGAPVRRAKVTLLTGTGGRWKAVTARRTDASGAVTLVLPPISESTAVRLRTAGGVHSESWALSLHPAMSVTSAAGPTPGTVVITVVASGAQPGDDVQLMTRGSQVAEGTLDSDDSISFTVTPGQRRTRYLVVVPATSDHRRDHAAITVVVRP